MDGQQDSNNFGLSEMPMPKGVEEGGAKSLSELASMYSGMNESDLQGQQQPQQQMQQPQMQMSAQQQPMSIPQTQEQQEPSLEDMAAMYASQPQMSQEPQQGQISAAEMSQMYRYEEPKLKEIPDNWEQMSVAQRIAYRRSWNEQNEQRIKQEREAKKSATEKFIEYTQKSGTARKIGLAAQGFAKSMEWMNPFVGQEQLQAFTPETTLEKAIETGSRVGGEAAQFAAGGQLLKGAGLLGTGATRASRIARAVLAGSPMGSQVISGVGAGAAEGIVQPESTLGKIATSVAGGMIAGGIAGLAKKGAVAAKDIANKAIQESFERTGVKQSAAATGSKALQAIERMLGGSATGAGVIQQSRDQQKEALETFFKKSVGKISDDVSTDDVVEAAKRGASGFKSRFDTVARQLYNKVDDIMPPTTQTPTSNLKKTAQEITSETARIGQVSKKIGEKVQDKFIKELADASDNADVGALRELRTKVGEKVKESLISGKSDAAYKRLYGAITKDIETAYSSNPEALRAFKRANAYYDAGQSRFGDVIKKISQQKKASDILSTAFGKEAKPTMILKRSLPREDYNILLGEKLRSLATTPDGAFDPTKFVKEFKKIPQNVRGAMFGGTEYAQLGKNIDDFSNVVSALYNNNSLKNPTGASVVLNTMVAGMGGIAGGPVGLTGALVAPYAISKMITNPTALKVLTASLRRVNVMAKSSAEAGLTQLRNELLKMPKRVKDPEDKALMAELSEELLSNVKSGFEGERND